MDLPQGVLVSAVCVAGANRCAASRLHQALRERTEGYVYDAPLERDAELE